MTTDHPSSVFFRLTAGCVRAVRFAWGGVGPCSRAGARSIDPARTWLGVMDLRTVPAKRANEIERFLASKAQLLLARNLILASPWMPGEGTDLLRTSIMDHAPAGWLDATRPVLLMVPGRPGEPAKIDFFSALKLAAPSPEDAEPAQLWARSFDAELLGTLAELAGDEEREALRRQLSSSDQRILEDIYDWAVVSLLDDLVGARDTDCASFPELEAAAELATVKGMDRLASVAAAIVELGRSDRGNATLQMLNEHCGSVALSSARGFEMPPPPMPGELEAFLDANDFLLLDEERERLWAAHWRASEQHRAEGPR